MKASPRALAIPVLGFALSVPLAARAQSTGFAVDRFDPSERGSEWFANESLDLRGHWRPAAGVILDYAYRPLVLYNQDGSVRASIVRDQLFTHLGGSVNLADRFRLAISIPVAPYQFGHDTSANGVTYTAPASADVGDIRLGVDARLLGEQGDRATVAIGLQTHLPSGRRESFSGDETLRLHPRALVAGEYGPLLYAAHAGFMYRAFDRPFAGSGLGSELVFGAAAGVRTANRALVVGPEALGSTVVDSDDGPFKTRNTPFELLLGAHYTFLGEWRAGAGVGPGLSRGYGSPVFRLVGSIEWVPPYQAAPADRDRDGVMDAEDACPDIPGVRTSDPRTNGCPPAPPADRDHDGIPDAEDACPDVPGIRTDDPRTNGCPSDRDKDTIPDAEDACPDVAGVRTNDPKTNGCPPDRDKDGVPDATDACPDVPGVPTDDPKTNGCPPDRDKDGIADDKDACPDEPGPPDPDPKKNGCPIAYVREGQIRILEQIKFRFNKAELDPASDPTLEAVAKIMNDHPEIAKVRVEGHTDNVGRAAYNLTLSKQRAAAVVGWLEKHGIDKKRLESQGLGLTRPIADNATEEGRKDNRRVEFHILEAPRP
jgi:outer membrane protein OmpA-like peptidoglycan-associated protein